MKYTSFFCPAFLDHLKSVPTDRTAFFGDYFNRSIEGIDDWVRFAHLQPCSPKVVSAQSTGRFQVTDRIDMILGNIARRLTYQPLISHE
jgi:hypothetical protein